MFEGWSDYFVLLGTASGGLIGLLFVVVTLTANVERSRALRAAGVYMTPIAVHFGVVLSVSAATLVPRMTSHQIAALIALFAALGLSAATRTCLGILEFRRGADPPHWSDLWGYGVGPATAYVALEVAALSVWQGAAWAVYLLAALLLTLMLLAIRNAWDLITWMAPGGGQPPVGPQSAG
jgi:hypothetical protein